MLRLWCPCLEGLHCDDFVDEISCSSRKLIARDDFGYAKCFCTVPGLNLFVIGKGQGRDIFQSWINVQRFQCLKGIEGQVVHVKDDGTGTHRKRFVDNVLLHTSFFKLIVRWAQRVPDFGVEEEISYSDKDGFLVGLVELVLRE
jgi:hypothetical protein